MKHKVFLIGLMSLLSMSFLSGCGEEQNSEHLDNLKDYVDANLEEKEDEEEIERDSVSYLDSNSFSDYTIINSSQARLGVVVLKNKTGHIGFYSLTHYNFIEECSYYWEWVSYSFDTSNGVLAIKIDYEGKTKIIDNLGNELYSGAKIVNWGIESCTYDSVVYLKLKVNLINYYFSYRDGCAEETFFYPEDDDLIPDVPDIPEDDDDRPSAQVGDLFKEGYIIDLKDYGNEGYYLNCSSRGVTTLFDSVTNKAINTFLIPLDTRPILTGKYVYYQKVYPLSEDNKDFAFYHEKSKYALTTIKVDMFTGVETTIDYNYLIGEAIPCKNSEGLYKNSIASVMKINDYKVLDEPRTVVIDDELKILKDYTGLQPNSFIKLSNGNYYNNVTKILYDSEMNVLTYLEYMNPVLLEKSNVFLGRIDGYYGLVDNEGKLITKFEYNNIIYNQFDNYVILQENQNYSLFNLETRNTIESYTDCNLRRLDNNSQLFAFEGKEGVDFVTLSEGVIKSIIGNYKFNYSEFISATNDYLALSLLYTNHNELTEERSSLNLVFKYGSEMIEFKTNGEENQSIEKTGRSWEDAIVVETGTNGVHSNPDGNYTYLSFTPSVTGLYNFAQPETSSVYLHHISILKYPEDSYYEEEPTLESFSFIDGTKAFLEAYSTYYITTRSTGYVDFEIELESEATDFSNQDEIVSYEESEMRKLTPTESGYYKLDLTNVTYTAYNFIDGRLSRISLTTDNYNDGLVFYYDVDVDSPLYFIFNNNQYNDYGAKFKLTKFDADSIPELDKDESIYVKYGEKVLRAFNCTTTGYYSLTSTSSYLSSKLYEIDLYGEFVEAPKESVNGKSYYSLTKGERYFVKTYNSYGSTYYVSLNVVALSYLALPTYSLGYDSISCSGNQGKYIKKFSVNTEGYYYFTNKDGSFESPRVPVIYKHTAVGDTVMKSQSLNGKNVYHFVPTESYFIYCDNSQNDFYTINSYEFTESNIPTIGNNQTNNYVGRSLFKFTASKTGYYRLITNTIAAIDSDVYEYNAETQQYTLVQAVLKETKNYYKLTANKQYYVLLKPVSNIDLTKTYRPTINYITDDLNNLPAFVATKDQFSENSGRFTSTNKASNSTSTLNFEINKAGTFTFNYDISSERSGDKIIVKLNGISVSLENNSGVYSNQLVQLNVKAGDVVTINYSKDSSYSSYNDNIVVYNVKFVETQATTSAN